MLRHRRQPQRERKISRCRKDNTVYNNQILMMANKSIATKSDVCTRRAIRRIPSQASLVFTMLASLSASTSCQRQEASAARAYTRAERIELRLAADSVRSRPQLTLRVFAQKVSHWPSLRSARQVFDSVPAGSHDLSRDAASNRGACASKIRKPVPKTENCAAQFEPCCARRLANNTNKMRQKETSLVGSRCNF